MAGQAQRKRSHGSGSVLKSKNYYYWRNYDATGIRHCQKLLNPDGSGCKTLREAEKAAKLLVEQKNALAGLDSREKLLKELADVRKLRAKLTISLEEAFELARHKPRRHNAGAKYLAAVQSIWFDFSRFVAAEYGISSIAEVEKFHAENYIAYIRANGRFTASKPAKLSNKTLNTALKNCCWVFTQIQDDLGYSAGDNPFAPIALLVKDEVGREIFSEHELRLIFSDPPPMMRGLFSIGLCSGMRLGDVVTLKWSDIKSYSDEISAGKPNFHLSEIVKTTQKTGVTVTVPIMGELGDYLSEQWEISGQDTYVLPEAAVMYQKNPSGVNYRIIRYLQSLGIATSRQVEGRTRKQSVKDFHSLRHCFCYYAGLRGIPLLVVQAIVGQLSEAMTRHYQQHADREAKRNALEAMHGLIVFNGRHSESQAEASPIGELMRRRISDFTLEADDLSLLQVNKLIDELTKTKSNFEMTNILHNQVDTQEPVMNTIPLELVPAPASCETLKILIKKFNRPRIGKIFDVTETTIRKWLAKFAIPAPKKYRLNGLISPEELNALRRIINSGDLTTLEKYQPPAKAITYRENFTARRRLKRS